MCKFSTGSNWYLTCIIMHGIDGIALCDLPVYEYVALLYVSLLVITIC